VASIKAGRAANDIGYAARQACDRILSGNRYDARERDARIESLRTESPFSWETSFSKARDKAPEMPVETGWVFARTSPLSGHLWQLVTHRKARTRPVAEIDYPRQAGYGRRAGVRIRW
jgi:hypothetical protein